METDIARKASDQGEEATSIGVADASGKMSGVEFLNTMKDDVYNKAPQSLSITLQQNRHYQQKGGDLEEGNFLGK